VTRRAALVLSVVIPVRNGMPFLEETVGSVLDQWTPEMELVIRDNRSTDGTLAFLESLDDPRIRIVESDEAMTAGSSWTATSRLARGRFTKLLCADDTLLPGGLGRQLQAAVDHPGAVLIASHRRVIDEAGKVVFRSHGLPGLTGEYPGTAAVRKAIAAGNNPFGEPSSVIFSTEALRQSLPFTEEFPYLTDLDMYVKVLQHGSFVGLQSVDATFRLHSTSWSQAVGASQLREYRAWRDDLSAHGALTLSWRERAVSNITSRTKFVGRRIVATATTMRPRSRP
jgi:glycosyltransferase involved in cell wall biosynthesis